MSHFLFWNGMAYVTPFHSQWEHADVFHQPGPWILSLLPLGLDLMLTPLCGLYLWANFLACKYL